MSCQSAISRAAQWFVRSGIQQPDGGVARYYRIDLGRNHTVSTEITGYAASALLSLNQPREALAAADFLACMWRGGAMPFEASPAPCPQFTYFFDCGIVIRGLLAAWRATAEQKFLDPAVALGESMLADFSAANGHYHPVLRLPDKQPLPWDPARWSQSPGCYQLKSGMAWWELFEATSDARFRTAYESLLDTALLCYAAFLPGHSDALKVVDRLHAFIYFLEGLLPHAREPRCAEALGAGIGRVTWLLEKTAGQFERSDVYAQLLRIRVYADWLSAAPCDRAAAEREAAILLEFQAASADPRLDGGFYFGRRAGNWLPYVNPVSTAFAAQALELWNRYSDGGPPACWRLLI